MGRGILFMVIGTFLFALFNALAKWLAADYSPFQIVFFRGLFGLLPLAALLLWERAPPPTLISRRPSLQVLRASLALGGIICFILAYRSMPLADTLAISYAAPIIVTLLSVPLLAESVGLHRWCAVAVGFFGVLLIIQPGTAMFDPVAFWAILGTTLHALMMLTTRWLSRFDATVCTMAHSTVIFIIGCGVALPFVWVAPDWLDLLLFCALGIVAGSGMFCFIRAFALGPAATIAPFEYTALLWATALGFLIWGDLPNHLAVSGMVIVAAAGLYILRRETIRNRRERPLAATPER